KIDEMTSVDIDSDIFIFSQDNYLCETDQLKRMKFYINNKDLNNQGKGDYLGYMVSGSLETLVLLSERNKKKGSQNNIQIDLLTAIKVLSKSLQDFKVDELPVSLYIVGHAALQYWE